MKETILEYLMVNYQPILMTAIALSLILGTFFIVENIYLNMQWKKIEKSIQQDSKVRMLDSATKKEIRKRISNY